jgi:hypothetical protein
MRWHSAIKQYLLDRTSSDDCRRLLDKVLEKEPLARRVLKRSAGLLAPLEYKGTVKMRNTFPI